ncbi:flavin reductase family protein [Anaerolineales bacterium]
MEIAANELSRKEVYKLLIGSVQPRPIAWVSTLNAEGQANLAPFSFFTVVSPNPPTICFCPTTRELDQSDKDTLNNIIETGEFVVNFVPTALVEQMNISATEYGPEVDEFEKAGLTKAPSRMVKAPRIAESPIQYECKLHDLIRIGDGNLVLGTVLYFHVDESVYMGNYKIDALAWQPLGRLAGNDYASVKETFEVKRLQP